MIKQIKRKVWIGFLIVTLCLSISACGKSNSDNSKKSNSETSSESKKVVTSEEKTKEDITNESTEENKKISPKTTAKEEYIPIVSINEKKSENLGDGDNKITSGDNGIDYVGSDLVGYTCLDNRWRSVNISDVSDYPILGEAKNYMAYEDPDNKYLLIMAEFGEATGNKEDLSEWVKERQSLDRTTWHYPVGSFDELKDVDDAGHLWDSLDKDSTIGYEFFVTVPRNDAKRDNLLRGDVFEYNGKRYGLMYLRYNDVWDVDFQSVCYYWMEHLKTDDEIIDQINNSPAMQNK